MPPSPKNVVYFNINSTAIYVSWDKQTLVELKGLADYIIEYSQFESVSNKKRQSRNMVTVPWTETHAVITNLTPGAMYNIFVSVSTSVGISGIYIILLKVVMSSRFGFRYNIICNYNCMVDIATGMREVLANTPSVASEKNAGFIIGGVVISLLFVTAIVVIIVITVVMYLRKRKDNFKTLSNQ